MTTAGVFILVAFAVVGIWVSFGWWRVLAVEGAILSLFGPMLAALIVLRFANRFSVLLVKLDQVNELFYSSEDCVRLLQSEKVEERWR